MVVSPDGTRIRCGVYGTYAEALEVARVRAARAPAVREARVLEACVLTHFYDVTYPRMGLGTPMQDLCIALVDSAMSDLRGVGTVKRDSERDRRRREALEWIGGISGCAPAVAFETCCEVLGLDPDATRKALLGIEMVTCGLRRRRGGAVEPQAD